MPLPLDPHPIPSPTIAAKTSTPSSVRQLRRRAGIPKKRTRASVDPPPIAKNLFNGRLNAALFELVVMVSVEVPALVPLILTEVGERLQATPLPLPDTLQARATLPVNPAEGVTEIVAVAELPAEIEPEVGLALSAKVGVAIVTVTVVVSVIGLDALVPVPVPVIVTV
jgi:hypothetical protein